MLFYVALTPEDISDAPLGVAEFLMEKSGLSSHAAFIPATAETATAETATAETATAETATAETATAETATAETATAEKPKKSRKSRAKPKPEPPAEVGEPPVVTAEQAKDAAIEFIERNDEAALGDILKTMGLVRLRDCPAEHLPEFLSRLAVA